MEGEAGCWIAPRRRAVATRTDEQRVRAIAALRRLRFTGPEIAEVLGMALSTVSGILTRIGMGKLGRLGLEPAVRYERQRPGELFGIDVKKLGRIERGAGHRVTGKRRYNPTTTKHGGIRRGLVRWEFVHIAIDDCTRMAYAEVLRREGHHRDRVLARAIAFSERQGITVEWVMTDNGSGYRSTMHALAIIKLGIRHLRTRPYRPADQRQSRTVHPDHASRMGLRRALPEQPRAHCGPGRLAEVLQLPTTRAIGHKPPIARLNERTNLLGTYS